jgi:hypothetical protein
MRADAVGDESALREGGGSASHAIGAEAATQADRPELAPRRAVWRQIAVKTEAWATPALLSVLQLLSMHPAREQALLAA